MKRLATLLVLAVTALWPAPASALTTDSEEVACPFDGTKFEVEVIVSMTQFGTNLDLKPQGALLAPAPLADCPTDGFVFIPGQTFSAEELESLRPHVFSDEYAAIRDETPYYRFAFLGRKLGAPPEDIAWRLLQATWEVDDEPARYDRYVRELLALLDTGIPDEGDTHETMMFLKGELLRRTGQFDAANAHFTGFAASLASDHGLQPIIAYELELTAAKDAAPHQVP